MTTENSAQALLQKWNDFAGLVKATRALLSGVSDPACKVLDEKDGRGCKYYFDSVQLSSKAGDHVIASDLHVRDDDLNGFEKTPERGWGVVPLYGKVLSLFSTDRSGAFVHDKGKGVFVNMDVVTDKTLASNSFQEARSVTLISKECQKLLGNVGRFNCMLQRARGNETRGGGEADIQVTMEAVDDYSGVIFTRTVGGVRTQYTVTHKELERYFTSDNSVAICCTQGDNSTVFLGFNNDQPDPFFGEDGVLSVENFVPDNAAKEKLADGLMQLIANLGKGLGHPVTAVTVADDEEEEEEDADVPFVITINGQDYTFTQDEIKRYADLEDKANASLVCRRRDSGGGGHAPGGNDALLCFTEDTVEEPIDVPGLQQQDHLVFPDDNARNLRSSALHRMFEKFKQDGWVLQPVQRCDDDGGNIVAAGGAPAAADKSFQLTVNKGGGVPPNVTYIVSCDSLERYHNWCSEVEADETDEADDVPTPPVLATNLGLVYWKDGERHLCPIIAFLAQYFPNQANIGDDERQLFSALTQLESSQQGVQGGGGAPIAIPINLVAMAAGAFQFDAPNVDPTLGGIVAYDVTQVRLQAAKNVDEALVFQCAHGGQDYHMIYQPNDPNHPDQPPMIFAGDLFHGIDDDGQDKLVRLLIKLQHSQGVSNVRRQNAPPRRRYSICFWKH